VAYYEVYQDGNPSPVATHWFQIAFVLGGGARSPLSPATTNKTWGFDFNGKAGIPDGLPDDWQRFYFGSKTSDWEGPNVDSDGDGATNWEEFLAGTNPRDPNDALKTRLINSPQGRRLSWSTVAGLVYQAQSTTDFHHWPSMGSPRFATGAEDSMLLPASQAGAYYRVVRVQ
jgi:hypothetical protein